MRVKNPDTEAEATATYWNQSSDQSSGRGNLDLKAKVDHLNVTSLVRYLPTSLNERVRTYLGHALQADTARHGTIEVHGDLTKFPYSKFSDAGKFSIVAPSTGDRFDPTPFPPRKMMNGTPQIWPGIDGIDGIDGTFHLAQNKLGFDIDRGHYRGRAREQGDRAHRRSGQSRRQAVDRRPHGSLTDMLHYVDDSSLGIVAKHATRKIDTKGDAALALTLGIPCYRPPAPLPPIKTDYKGSLTFGDHEVHCNNLPSLTRLYGRADFAEKTVTLTGLSAQLLGGNVRAKGDVKPDGSYTLDVNGRIGALQARFAKVAIPDKTEDDLIGKVVRKPPRNMPSIDLIVNELVYRNRDLGRLEVDAHNDFVTDDPVWMLDKFELANDDATLSANATWRDLAGTTVMRAAQQETMPYDTDDDIPCRTSLDFRLDGKNGGQLMDRFGLPRTVKGSCGTVTGHADLEYGGGPTSIDMTTLDGNASVDLKHGADSARAGCGEVARHFQPAQPGESADAAFRGCGQPGPAVREDYRQREDRQRHRPDRRLHDDHLARPRAHARAGRSAEANAVSEREGDSDRRRGRARDRPGSDQSAARSRRAHGGCRALEVDPESLRNRLLDHQFVAETGGPATARRSG